jgi:drug/metabolite transporter (DMT)-like permease
MGDKNLEDVRRADARQDPRYFRPPEAASPSRESGEQGMPLGRPPGALAAPNRLKGYALATLAALCWATGGLTAKWLFTPLTPVTASWAFPPLGIAIDPLDLSGARALAAAVLIMVYLALADRRALRIQVRDLPFLAVFGVFGLAAVHFTYFKTLSLTGVATAILLEYLAPILVLVFSVVFLRERPSWRLPVAVLLSVGGCALVAGAVGGGVRISAAGLAWGLTSAFFFALYTLLGKYAAGRYGPWTLLAYGLVAATLFWFAYLGPARIFGVFADQRTALAVLFVAVVSTVIPFGAFLVGLHHIQATEASITSTLEPAVAGVGASWAFGETLGPLQLVGGALVLAAILLVQLPAQRGELPPAT